jgi:hypothetical protein
VFAGKLALRTQIARSNPSGLKKVDISEKVALSAVQRRQGLLALRMVPKISIT